jgi:putative Ca2+/H+ antiporter (TMEM165/GDT1 family)
MFANLLLATRGHPGRVWLGAAVAFTVHVAIAVTVGVTLFDVLPKRAVEASVAFLFLAGAVYAWNAGAKADTDLVLKEGSRHGAAVASFVVIFLAEWGDLTQILTADLAAKYHSPISVATGALAALWAVAAIAVLGGRALVRLVDVATIRKLTAAVLVVLAGFSGFAAFN